MPWYRLRVDQTYTTNASANTALASINSTLAAQGRSERAVKTGQRVQVTVEPVATAQAASALGNALTPGWAIGTRTTGSTSLELRDESAL